MARYDVKVLPWAVADVRETYLYLLERDYRLAEDFELRVREAILSLGETAQHYQVRDGGFRRCPLKRFPHGIMYEIEDDQVVIVHAVAHPKRKPGFWRKRS